MEQREVGGWSDMEKIDQIRRANSKSVVLTQALNTSQNLKNQSGQNQKSGKSMPCVCYNNKSCNFQKHHETKEVLYRHICSTCFSQDGMIIVQNFKVQKLQKTINSGHSR